MIEFKNLHIEFNDKPLFTDFSLTVEDGDKVVFFGPSGAGKTTLLNCVLGFIRPQAGDVIVDGVVLNETTINAIRRKIAWLPQEFTLPYASVKEMMEAIFRLKVNRYLRVTHERILVEFSRLGLTEALFEKRLSELSGGQRQRVMIAIAALLDKKIVLIDEPTSALDPASTQMVISYIKQMKEKTVLAVSHDRRFIESFDRSVEIR